MGAAHGISKSRKEWGNVSCCIFVFSFFGFVRRPPQPSCIHTRAAYRDRDGSTGTKIAKSIVGGEGMAIRKGKTGEKRERVYHTASTSQFEDSPKSFFFSISGERRGGGMLVSVCTAEKEKGGISICFSSAKQWEGGWIS